LKHIIDVNMDLACSMASISHGKRLQVGAVLVTANDVVLRGVNGLPKPLGNELEYEVEDSVSLVTKPTVIHAELNCLLKAAREGVSVVGSTLFVTHSPCPHCASMLASAGVVKVYYKDVHRNGEGLEVLKQCGIEAVKLERRLSIEGEE
jgi:dCMP deaminase